VRVLDLFSGIGGFSLGLERAGMRTVAFCENHPFARRVLLKHWPEIPIYDDVRNLSPDGIAVDVICGGFPCQPFSNASHGRRVAVDLWPDMLRVIKEFEPRIVIAENVQEAAIANAARDLKGLGYKTDHRCISGANAGADHQRNRWWLVAHPYDESKFRSALDAEVAELQALCRSVWGSANYARAIRVSDGVPNRMDRLGRLGNAVIPMIPNAIGRAIMALA